MHLRCGVNIWCHIRSVCIDDDEEQASGSQDQSDDNAVGSTATWPDRPADYNSEEDVGNLSDEDETVESVEKFKRGEYVCLMVGGDPEAYAQFRIHNHVNLPVTALMKSPCRLQRFGPGVYALVEFCHELAGVITIQVVSMPDVTPDVNPFCCVDVV